MAVADEVGFEVKNNVEVPLGNDRNDLLKIVEAYKREYQRIWSRGEVMNSFKYISDKPSIAWINNNL